MYVIVDREYVFFWDDSLRVQNFKGVTLYQPAGIQNMSHIIAMFDSGAGVEVMSTYGRMMVRTYLPVTYLNSTGGLLGFYNRVAEDDLLTPSIPAGNVLVDCVVGNVLRKIFRYYQDKELESQSTLHWKTFTKDSA